MSEELKNEDSTMAETQPVTTQSQADTQPTELHQPANASTAAAVSSGNTEPTTTTTTTTATATSAASASDAPAHKTGETEEEMRARLAMLQQEESQLLEAMQSEGQKSEQEALQKTLQEPKEDVDARSVYVGNVDYGTTPAELQQHFQACGTINRVTIITDRQGHPKGFAYVEFAEPQLVSQALVLNESMFRGRALKVTLKRTNIPGHSFRGRGRGRGGRGGRGGGYRGGYRGRGRGFAPY